MKNTKITSITAVFVIATMVAACATPNGSGSLSPVDPCQPGGAQTSLNPQSSFVQQNFLNPLARIGGTLLATAAANYSGKYTKKLNKLLTKLVTPKKKKKKKPNQQFVDQSNQFDNQGGQPDFGFENQVAPNTGFPIQDPSGFPGQDDFGQTQGQIDPNTGFPIDPGFGEEEQFQQGFPQEGVQPRGVPGQFPHATFPSNPCDQQMNPQTYPTGYPQNQPYGYDPNVAQQGQPYPNDPNYQGQGYDPYSQQQGQAPSGQAYPSDPYAQQGYPQDPYSQQQGQDPYGQPYPSDPYAQQGYPQDPYGQQPTQQDPYAQQGYPNDPYAQQGYPQDPYAPTDYQTVGGTIGTPIGLDVVMVKQTRRNGTTVMVPMQDGDVLKDGRGNVNAGDKFRIMFRPHTDGFVYVVAIDGSGWAQGIFPPPTSPLANPVKAGEQYVLPEGNNWFSLDQFKGIETIFFVASQEKRQDLEEILQSITGRERPATATPQQVTKVAMVPYGVGSARPSGQGFNLSAGSGQDQPIMPTSYFAKAAGEDLRLTRWFRHE
jgi:hypothetical protein